MSRVSTGPFQCHGHTIDRIQKLFGLWNHSLWDFVIYRCTYASDEDFMIFLDKIKVLATESLKFYGADEHPLAQHLSWTVVEDRSQLDGTSKAAVRKRFDEWCRSSEAAAEQPGSAHPVARSPNARYRFTVQIDLASLNSSKDRQKSYVNVITRTWPYEPPEDDNDDDEGDDEEDQGFEEIGESMEEDLCWCKVRTSHLLPDSYSQLCHPNACQSIGSLHAKSSIYWPISSSLCSQAYVPHFVPVAAAALSPSVLQKPPCRVVSRPQE
nr:hypothetical protein CFP56_78438 [Quercus suber]